MNGQPRECIGIFGRLFGHKFRPRQDTESKLSSSLDPVLGGMMEQKAVASMVGQILSKFTSSDESMEDIIGAFKEEKSTYVGDVCQRCGAVLRREQASGGPGQMAP